MTADEARKLMLESERKNAVDHKIKMIENKIRENAKRGNRSCIVSFFSYNSKSSPEFDLETEIKEYFVGNGFSFKLITDDICGGVRQSPYWTICW